jgi:hypothetical protein
MSTTLPTEKQQFKDKNLKNVYTDAPALHPNLLPASLQLLVWLFFHPSAWRNHIARIDPTLSPNFTLARLTRNNGIGQSYSASYSSDILSGR